VAFADAAASWLGSNQHGSMNKLAGEVWPNGIHESGPVSAYDGDRRGCAFSRMPVGGHARPPIVFTQRDVSARRISAPWSQRGHKRADTGCHEVALSSQAVRDSRRSRRRVTLRNTSHHRSGQSSS
jgi:hypothetical protein